MYAVGLVEYGGPEVLHDVELPDPHPATGQVRIKVRAAGINPVDVMVRDGSLAGWFGAAEKPFIPGMDVSGTIDEIGEGVDQQSGVSIGQDVVAVIDNFGSYGAYSEYVCVPATSVIPLPKDTGFAEAGSFLMNALTARQALDALQLPAGSSLLVTGAAGAVGAYTVTLANEDGLNVIAIGSAGDDGFLRRAGASEVLIRGEDLGARVRQILPGGVDAVVDAAALGDSIAPAVRDGGTIITLRPVTDEAMERGIATKFVNVRERINDQDAIIRLGQQVESGLLAIRVAGTFPATEARLAHRRFDEGKLRGRLVLLFDV